MVILRFCAKGFQRVSLCDLSPVLANNLFSFRWPSQSEIVLEIFLTLPSVVNFSYHLFIWPDDQIPEKGLIITISHFKSTYLFPIIYIEHR